MSRPLTLALLTIAVLVSAPPAMATGTAVATVGVPGGEGGRFAYDPYGRLVRADVGGRTTMYDYDDDGRLVGPGGSVVEYSYDPDVVTYEYESARLAYDRVGRLVAITGADGGVTSFAYDAAGRLTYVLPEVDDEVIVAFLPGDPREPYVVGVLWQEDRSDGERTTFSVTTHGRPLACSACP